MLVFIGVVSFGLAWSMTAADLATASERGTNKMAQAAPSPEQAAAALEAKDVSRPHVTNVWPEDGARDVPSECALRIRFDHPMDPMSFKLNWKSGGFLESGEARYDSNRYEFTFPVRLALGTNQQVFVNAPFMGVALLAQSRQQFPVEGFHSTDQRQAAFFLWQFRTRAATPPATGAPPKVISLSPASGSTVPLLTFIEVQFDQPMMSPTEGLPWLGSQTNIFGRKNGALIPYVTYNSSNHVFRLPVLLPSRDEVHFQVAGHRIKLPRLLTPEARVRFTLEGFRSAAGIPAPPIPVEYRVFETELSKAERKKTRRKAKDEQLLELLTAMKRRRAGLHSLAERVQILQIGCNQSLFASLDSKSAAFQMQLPGQFYGDVAELMLSRVFRIGSDGHDWWFQPGETNLVVCPAGQMDICDLSFAEPFNLLSNSVTQAATEKRLAYAGRVKVAGATYHLIEAWKVDVIEDIETWGGLQQWWIDDHTLLPAELLEFVSYGVYRTRFFYDTVNRPLEAQVFAVPRIAGVVPTPPDALGTNYTQRLVIIHDGADGRMSERWGMQGPKMSVDSGLN